MKTIQLIACLLIATVNVALSQQKGDSVFYKTETNIQYRDSTKEQLTDYMRSNCVLDVYYPVNVKGFKTVVWFHGGGLTGWHKELPDELKNQNVCVVSVEYRLAPKAKCPDYIDDAAAAVAWVFKNIGKYNGDAGKIYVSGHSAGGYLTLMIGLDKKWLAKYDVYADSIKALVPFSGQTITHFTIRKERGIADKQPIIDEYAPLYHVRANAPKLVLITGDRELEMLGRYEENAYLMRMMKVAGHKSTALYELQGFDHVGMAKPAFPLLLKELNF